METCLGRAKTKQSFLPRTVFPVAALVTPRKFRAHPLQIGKFLLLCGAVLLLILRLPNHIWAPTASTLLLSVGLIAVWRYAWWTTHVVRSRIYALLVFPKLR